MKLRALQFIGGTHLLVGVLLAIGSFFAFVSGSAEPVLQVQGMALIALPLMGLGSALFILIEALGRVEELERRILEREGSSDKMA